MNEFAVAQVDTNVAVGTPHGVEKYEITGLQLGLVDPGGGGSLFFGAAGKDQARGFLKHGTYEAAAIKTRFSGISASAVRYPQGIHGIYHEIRSTVGGLLNRVAEFGDQAFLEQQFVDFILSWCRVGRAHSGEEDNDGKQCALAHLDENLCSGKSNQVGACKSRFVV